MVKVLHVISDTGIGGAGVLLCNLLSCLDRKRFEVTVVVPKGSMLVPRIRSLEIAVIEIPHGADRSADFRAITALFRIVRAERPHIIHTHSALYARLAGWFCRVPVSVNTRHCAYMNEPSSPISRLATYCFERMTGNRTIATADYVKEVLLTRGVPSNAIHIIHNGSSPCRKLTEKEKNDVRRNLGLSESNFIVGIVARLEAGKGHETLLRAARICIEKTPSIRFVIVGDGSRSEKLRKLAHDLGLEKHVIFTGFCPDVAPFMNILHLNVNCSEQSETSSLSLSEGMSVGAVPVVSNCGGNSYMAGFGESGMIFPIGDSAALANIILALEKKRIELEELSRKCIERFQQHLTATEMTRQVEALYDRLLQTL